MQIKNKKELLLIITAFRESELCGKDYDFPIAEKLLDDLTQAIIITAKSDPQCAKVAEETIRQPFYIDHGNQVWGPEGLYCDCMAHATQQICDALNRDHQYNTDGAVIASAGQCVIIL